jgi:glutaredoxin
VNLSGGARRRAIVKANAFVVLCVTAFLASTAAYADQALYRWTDQNGRVFYTDKPPPGDARNVERKQLGDRAGTGPLPYATQMAAKAFPVTLYTSDCGEACESGRRLLEERGVPFAEKAARDAAVQTELLKLVGGTTVEVPVLVVGRTIVRGWEATQWHSTLDAAGYPKSSAGPRPATPARRTTAGTPKEPPRTPGDMTPPPAGGATKP